MERIKLFKGITRYLWVIRRYPLDVVDYLIDRHGIKDHQLEKSYVMNVELTGDQTTDILLYLSTD